MQRRFSAPARNSIARPEQRRQKTKEWLHVKSASSETSVAILGLIAWMQAGGATLPRGRRFTRIYRGWKTITAWCCDAHFRAVDERTSIRLIYVLYIRSDLSCQSRGCNGTISKPAGFAGREDYFRW